MAQTEKLIHICETNADLSEPQTMGFLGGQLSFVCQRSPDKPTINEDSFAAVETSDTSGVILVADGCGGEAHGAAASKISIELLHNSLCKLAEQEEVSGEDVRSCIVSNLEKANEMVLQLGSGAATTIAVIEIQGERYRTYHAGDTQIVSLTGEGMLLSLPHAPVGYGVAAGILSEQEAFTHEDRHYVANVLGSPDTFFDMSVARPLPTLPLVVASDGLFDNVQTEELYELMSREGLTARELTESCFQLAQARMLRAIEQQAINPMPIGKPDDLTIACFQPGVPLRVEQGQSD